MHKTIWASTFAIAAFAFGSEAHAQAALHDGNNLRAGDNMIYPELGWPELVFGFQHGVSNSVDVGIRASLIYGWDYTTLTTLGLGVRVPIRIQALRREKVSVQITIGPGLKFDDFSGSAACIRADPLTGVCLAEGAVPSGYNAYVGYGLHFGPQLDLGVDIGIHLTREMTITPGFEMPIFINLTNGSYATIPLLFGANFQYDINDRMSVGGGLKLGATIIAGGNNYGCGALLGGFGCGVPAPLAVNTYAFFGYKL